MSAGRIVLICTASLFAPGARAGADLSRYSVVRIAPVKTSVYVGSVTLTVTPFLHLGSNFTSTYSAKVFPYFFYNEAGKISIPITDETLRKLSQGETITFSGKGVSDQGSERLVEGKATPTGPDGGKIKVRISVSKRIALIFNTTYELSAPKPAQPSAH
jgi:hypothetical protein